MLKRHQMRYREDVIIKYQIEVDFLCVFAYDGYSIMFLNFEICLRFATHTQTNTETCYDQWQRFRKSKPLKIELI